MRDLKLSGAWSGYEFRSGALITPEGRKFHHDDLRWLSLTIALKNEWTQLMEDDRRKAPLGRGKVIHLRDVLRARKQQKAVYRDAGSACQLRSEQRSTT